MSVTVVRSWVDEDLRDRDAVEDDPMVTAIDPLTGMEAGPGYLRNTDPVAYEGESVMLDPQRMKPGTPYPFMFFQRMWFAVKRNDEIDFLYVPDKEDAEA